MGLDNPAEDLWEVKGMVPMQRSLDVGRGEMVMLIKPVWPSAPGVAVNCFLLINCQPGQFSTTSRISLCINSSKRCALAQKMLSNPLKSIGEGVLAKPGLESSSLKRTLPRDARPVLKRQRFSNEAISVWRFLCRRQLHHLNT